jgi:hypothetical protein
VDRRYAFDVDRASNISPMALEIEDYLDITSIRATEVCAQPHRYLHLSFFMGFATTRSRSRSMSSAKEEERAQRRLVLLSDPFERETSEMSTQRYYAIDCLHYLPHLASLPGINLITATSFLISAAPDGIPLATTPIEKGSAGTHSRNHDT